MTRKGLLAIGAVVLVALCAPTRGDAQEQAASDVESTALARALFNEGLEMLERRDWLLASDRFARALELRASPVIGYNLGLALYRLGRLVEASERLQTVVSDETTGEAARQLLEQIEPQLGRLRVTVLGPLDDVHVFLNDRELPHAGVGVHVPVDPGLIRVGAHRHGVVVAEDQIVIEAGTRGEVQLRVRPGSPQATLLPASGNDAAPNPTVVPGPAGATSPSHESDDDSSPWIWIGVGGVVGVGVVVAAILLSAESPKPVRGDFDPAVIRGGAP